MAPGIPSAYGKAEDIRPLVHRHLAGINDSDVYVYHAAKPAVTFHYPTRRFVIGQPPTRRPEDTVRDILDRMRGPELWILASHFPDGAIDAIVAGLAARDWHLEETHLVTGAAALRLRSGDVVLSSEIQPGE